MRGRRKEDRNLCADLLEIGWKDALGNDCNELAGLEDISRTGLSLGTENAIPVGTRLTVRYPNGKFVGKIVYCHHDELGYVIGLKFDPGYSWSRRQYRPSHLLQFRLRAIRK